MSAPRDFSAAALDDDVLNDLKNIEDKIRERGFIVTATGDPEADISIRYEDFGDECGESGHFLCIRIIAEGARFEGARGFEFIVSYVNEKISFFGSRWSGDVRAALQDVRGLIVFLNGKNILTEKNY